MHVSTASIFVRVEIAFRELEAGASAVAILQSSPLVTNATLASTMLGLVMVSPAAVELVTRLLRLPMPPVAPPPPAPPPPESPTILFGVGGAIVLLAVLLFTADFWKQYRRHRAEVRAKCGRRTADNLEGADPAAMLLEPTSDATDTHVDAATVAIELADLESRPKAPRRLGGVAGMASLDEEVSGCLDDDDDDDGGGDDEDDDVNQAMQDADVGGSIGVTSGPLSVPLAVDVAIGGTDAIFARFAHIKNHRTSDDTRATGSTAAVHAAGGVPATPLTHEELDAAVRAAISGPGVSGFTTMSLLGPPPEVGTLSTLPDASKEAASGNVPVTRMLDTTRPGNLGLKRPFETAASAPSAQEVSSEDPLMEEAMSLTHVHGRGGVEFTIMEFKVLILTLDEAEGLPARCDRDIMRLFSLMDTKRKGKLDATDIAKLLNKVYKRKRAASTLDVHGEARTLTQAHGRPDGTFTLMEFMDIIEAIDEADALPKRKRSEVMSLFSNTKAEGEHVDEAAIVRLLVNTYGRTQVL